MNASLAALNGSPPPSLKHAASRLRKVSLQRFHTCDCQNTYDGERRKQSARGQPGVGQGSARGRPPSGGGIYVIDNVSCRGDVYTPENPQGTVERDSRSVEGGRDIF